MRGKGRRGQPSACMRYNQGRGEWMDMGRCMRAQECETVGVCGGTRGRDWNGRYLCMCRSEQEGAYHSQ